MVRGDSPMKVAVFEHFTAQDDPRGGVLDMVAEGRAIRDAAVADLARLPGIEVVVVGHRRGFAAALRTAEAALVIAPETDGVLERLSRQVERSGRLLLGPSSGVVRLMGDKLRCARVLTGRGIPTPATRAIPLASAGARLRSLPTPFVLKPRDGCGSRGVIRVRSAREIGPALRGVRRATRRGDCLAQEYVSGPAVSVSFIMSPRPLSLGLNLQRLGRGAFDYRGGETLVHHAQGTEAIAIARAAVEALERACGGIRGYVGVDLVLGRTGPVVIEVNPRLTTSYVGLRRSIAENLAGWIVDAARGTRRPGRITWMRRI